MSLIMILIRDSLQIQERDMGNKTDPTGPIALFLLIIGGLIFFTSGRSIFAYHGEEVIITLNSAYFTALTESGNHQVKVITNYTISNSSIAGQKMNAVMKVYSVNGTLLKTTSFPTGFIINKTGTAQLLTNIPDSAQNIVSVTTFTNLGKTLSLSNPLNVTLNLGQSIK
ncbi:MAG: hypothetical protein M3530_01585 [Thermoproteota archaeon]|nr:hypothetical protein [Thermoproteota archaeon]